MVSRPQDFVASIRTMRYSLVMIDVRKWLVERGFEHMVDLFVKNEIDGEVLFDLTDDDLKELDLALGARKKLLKAIANGNVGESPRVPASVEAHSARTPEGPADGPHSAERRQLTIMFVDMVGSTALSEKLDPEDMREVITDFQNAVAGVVTRFDGQVAKYMGDGVLCYFGWPKAHEDDAERAVRAGRAIMKALAKLKLPDGGILRARVGVATGLVVVGDLIGEGAAQEEAVVGDTPNLAARLQALDGHARTWPPPLLPHPSGPTGQNRRRLRHEHGSLACDSGDKPRSPDCNGAQCNKSQ